MTAVQRGDKMKIEVGDLVCSEYTRRTGIITEIIHSTFGNSYAVEWYEPEGKNYIETYFNENAIIRWKQQAEQKVVDSSEK